MAILHQQLFDALILGGGPGGLSTANQMARLLRTALVIDSGVYRNDGSSALHSVISRDGIDPVEFRRTAKEQIQAKYDTYEYEHLLLEKLADGIRYQSIEFARGKIIHVEKKKVDEEGYVGFEAVDEAGVRYRGKKLVLATGSREIFPDFEGFAENWPQNIYQCLYCDGFERRNLPVGILGFPSPMYAHYAQMTRLLTSDVTIFSDGPVPPIPSLQAALSTALALGARLDTRAIIRLVANPDAEPGRNITVVFEHGVNADLAFLTHRPRTESVAGELVKQLGLEISEAGEVVKSAATGETSLAGVWVVGDAGEPTKHVTIAMAGGALTGGAVNLALGREEMEKVHPGGSIGL